MYSDTVSEYKGLEGWWSRGRSAAVFIWRGRFLGRDFLRGLFYFLFSRLEIFVAGKFGLAFAAEIWYNMRHEARGGF